MARWAPRIAWGWAGACFLLVWGGLLFEGRAPAQYFAAGIGVTYLFILLAPAILLGPCWAEERERGTLESWALAPRAVADLWRMQIAARIRPWQPPLAVALLVLGVGVVFKETLDGGTLLAATAGLVWIVTAAVFAEGWAAWVATVYRGTVACIAVGLLGALGVETILFLGVSWLQVVLFFYSSASRFMLFLAGVLPPLMVHVPLGLYYRHFAHKRLERMLHSLYP